MARRDNAPAKRRTNKQLTANQKEWQHQVQNLKRRIKDLEALGAQVAFAIPEMPAKVTKAAIEKIKKIRREQLLKNAYQTGEGGEAEPFVPPARGWTKQRREKVKREREAEVGFPEGEGERIPIESVELDNLLGLISWLDDQELIEMLTGIIGEAVAEKGVQAINEIAKRYRDDLMAYAVDAQKYKGQNKGGKAITEFTRIIKGSALSTKEMRVIERANDRFDDFSSPS